VLQVGGDRSLPESETRGDLSGGQSLGGQLQHVLFSAGDDGFAVTLVLPVEVCQGHGASVAASRPDQPIGRQALEDDFTLGGPADALHEHPHVCVLVDIAVGSLEKGAGDRGPRSVVVEAEDPQGWKTVSDPPDQPRAVVFPRESQAHQDDHAGLPPESADDPHGLVGGARVAHQPDASLVRQETHEPGPNQPERLHKDYAHGRLLYCHAPLSPRLRRRTHPGSRANAQRRHRGGSTQTSRSQSPTRRGGSPRGRSSDIPRGAIAVRD
jgi:hypothetical protein